MLTLLTTLKLNKLTNVCKHHVRVAVDDLLCLILNFLDASGRNVAARQNCLFQMFENLQQLILISIRFQGQTVRGWLEPIIFRPLDVGSANAIVKIFQIFLILKQDIISYNTLYFSKV